MMMLVVMQEGCLSSGPVALGGAGGYYGGSGLIFWFTLTEHRCGAVSWKHGKSIDCHGS